MGGWGAPPKRRPAYADSDRRGAVQAGRSDRTPRPGRATGSPAERAAGQERGSHRDHPCRDGRMLLTAISTLRTLPAPASLQRLTRRSTAPPRIVIRRPTERHRTNPSHPHDNIRPQQRPPPLDNRPEPPDERTRLSLVRGFAKPDCQPKSERRAGSIAKALDSPHHDATLGAALWKTMEKIA